MEKKAEKYLPLTEATFYIMISLTKPMHGYGIMQNVLEISSGTVKLGPGTLYGALAKLQKEKLIEFADVDETQDERRKCYTLTSLGKKVVLLEYERLRTLAGNAERIIENMGRG